MSVSIAFVLTELSGLRVIYSMSSHVAVSPDLTFYLTFCHGLRDTVVYKIAECVGLEQDFEYPYMYATLKSKKHGQSVDFFNALTMYGHEAQVNMTLADLNYAKSWKHNPVTSQHKNEALINTYSTARATSIPHS